MTFNDVVDHNLSNFQPDISSSNTEQLKQSIGNIHDKCLISCDRMRILISTCIGHGIREKEQNLGNFGDTFHIADFG